MSSGGSGDDVLRLALQLGSLRISIEETIRPGDHTQQASFHRAAAALIAALPASRSPAPSVAEPASEPATPTAAAAAAADTRQEPDVPPPLDEDREPTWAERLVFAREAGESALLRLQGIRVLTIAGRRSRLQTRVYVLLRDRANVRPATGAQLFTTWGSLRDQVTSAFASPSTGRRELSPCSVFHGFPSLSEAEAYSLGAGATLQRLPTLFSRSSGQLPKTTPG
jgi:hypothetical protein